MAFKIMFVFCMLHLIAANETGKLKVSIYYETYCPCSISFITKQFFPGYVKLRDYLEIDFVPSGNTTQEFKDGSWIFECKHGKQECRANKIHACTLVQEIKQYQKVDFVYCTTEGKYEDYQLETCASLAEISWKQIKNCVEDPATDDVLAEFGKRSKMANLTHIPAVIFNDQYDKTLDENARRGFLETACSLLQSQAPAACGDVTMEDIV